MEKVLLAGPWIGEMGWELFCWEGFVRKQSRNYDRTIVIGRPGNGFLSKDFADRYIEFDPGSFKTDAWNCHGAKDAKQIIASIPHTNYLTGKFDIGMRYTKNGVVDTRGFFFKEQEFYKYTTDITYEGYDVIFHCRNKSTGADRNWDASKWRNLLTELPDDLKVACIGNHEAFHIDGTKDLRGMDLEDLCILFKNSKIVVGPSSGPMHYASLCGTKHLVWSTEYNRVRYEKDWNPFNTEVIFYSAEEWNPEPKNIATVILKNI